MYRSQVYRKKEAYFHLVSDHEDIKEEKVLEVAESTPFNITCYFSFEQEALVCSNRMNDS